MIQRSLHILIIGLFAFSLSLFGACGDSSVEGDCDPEVEEAGTCECFFDDGAACDPDNLDEEDEDEVCTCYFAGEGPTGGQTNTVILDNNMFNPQTLTISVGTTITWTNNDPDQHVVSTANGNPSDLDSGPLNSGGSYSYTFNTAGTFQIIDRQNDAPGLKMTITVQ